MDYRREIDGLRAIAVVPVILYHAGFTIFSGGFIGVDIFFVISGFLITSIIQDEINQKKFSIINFYERRARRILPALFFMEIFAWLLAFLWFNPDYFREFSQSLVAVSLFSSNLFFYLKGGYFTSDSDLIPLLHTWTIAVEEQYYVFFPLLLMLFSKTSTKYLLGTVFILTTVSLFYAQTLVTSNAKFAYLMLPTRFWELAMGAMVAIHFRQELPLKTNKYFSEALSLIGILCIGYSIFVFDKETLYPSYYTLLPTVGTALIIIYASKTNYVGKLLGTKFLVGIGLISYSAYLWHQPLFVVTRHRLIEDPEPIIYLLLSVASLVIGYISWKFIEAPFRNKKKVSRKVIFIFSIAGSSLFILLGLGGHITQGLPARFTDELNHLSIRRHHLVTTNSITCKLQGNEFNLNGCTKGDKNVTPRVALLGDSHAASLVNSLDTLLQDQEISFLPLAKVGCIFNLVNIQKAGAKLNSCSSYQSAIFEQVIAKDLIDVYIVYVRVDRFTIYSKEKFQELFNQHIYSVKKLIETGKKIIIVYPTPVYTKDIPDYMWKNAKFYNNQKPSIQEPTADFRERVNTYYSQYDQLVGNNIYRIKTIDVLCGGTSENLCNTELKGKPLYFDKDHLSNFGANLVNDKIIKILLEL